MKVAVVIPTVNLWVKYTKPCIDSVKSSKHDLRILLVDQASTDETREEAGKLVSSTFAHQRNEEIWCCSRTWNHGVKDAFERGYDYVLVLNNDVLLHPDAIDLLVERFSSLVSTIHPKDASLEAHMAAKLEHEKPLAMVTLHDVTSECTRPEDIFIKDRNEKKDVPESEHPCFSGFMLTKEAYEAVGPFDEEFKPCYFEDNDYHHRINAAGMKAIVLPTAMMYHYGSRTQIEALGGVPICPAPMFERNKAYYVEKWGGMPGHETFTKPFNK